MEYLWRTSGPRGKPKFRQLADGSDGKADAIADDGTADESSMNTTAMADESDGKANATADDGTADESSMMRARAKPTRRDRARGSRGLGIR